MFFTIFIIEEILKKKNEKTESRIYNTSTFSVTYTFFSVTLFYKKIVWNIFYTKFYDKQIIFFVISYKNS